MSRIQHRLELTLTDCYHGLLEERHCRDTVQEEQLHNLVLDARGILKSAAGVLLQGSPM